MKIIEIQLGVIIFSLVQFLFKKVIKLKLKKNKTELKPVSVRFGFFGQNLVQTGLDWFFLFGFGSVRFFRFQAYKTETEPNRSFFKKFNRFFSLFGFFGYFFPVFWFFYSPLYSILVFFNQKN